MAKRTFSFAYSKFVPDPNSDVVGLIAYSLYKRDKAAEIRRLVQEGKGEPTEDGLISWSKHNSTDNRVEEYKVLARRVLERLIESEVKEVYEPQLRKSIENETIGLIRSDLNNLTGGSGFWGGVATSCGGAVVWVVVTAAIVFVSTGTWPWSAKGPAQQSSPSQLQIQQKNSK
jgi:hypothetical protein